MNETKDTGDKIPDNSVDTPSEDIADIHITTSENYLLSASQETENMEVHKHPHHVMHKKKWPEYLLEFFMLFLAVFLGFLAENLREHITDQEKEKQYMQSLVADLREDTLEISKSISSASTAKRYEDSVIFYIYSNPPRDFLPTHFLEIDFKALLRLKVVFNEVTALQLRNAGTLRLIRKQDIIRKISFYWNEQENTKISLDRYLNYRNRGREFSEKLFAFSDDELVAVKLIQPLTKGVRVIQKEPALWTEYTNIQSHCSTTIVTYLDQLKKQHKLATDLILLLQNEYHL